MPEDVITITHNDLFVCFLQWERERREGKCASDAEAAAKSAEQLARENADHFWDRLHG